MIILGFPRRETGKLSEKYHCHARNLLLSGTWKYTASVSITWPIDFYESD